MEDRKVKGNEGEQGELEEQMERCSFGKVSDCLVVEVVGEQREKEEQGGRRRWG